MRLFVSCETHPSATAALVHTGRLALYSTQGPKTHMIPPQSNDKKLRVAVVGCGRQGKVHAQNVSESEAGRRPVVCSASADHLHTLTVCLCMPQC